MAVNGSRDNGSDTALGTLQFYKALVPEGTDVLPPLEKKRFAGGVYAAHMIWMSNFEEWDPFIDWIKNNDEY